MANFWENDAVVETPQGGGNFWENDPVVEAPTQQAAPAPTYQENNPTYVPSQKVITPQPQVSGALPQWLTNILPKGNSPTPAPEVMGAGRYNTWTNENIVAPAIEGVINTPRNLAETAEILAPEGSALKSMGQAITKNVPEVVLAPNKGATGEVVGAIAPIFLGGAGGLKLAGQAATKVKGLINATSKMGKALEKGLTHVAKGFGFEAGGVAASDVDLGTGFVGKNSAFGDSEWNILKDWGFDTEGNPDEVRFEKKANQMIEGLIGAGVGDMATKIVSKLWTGTIGPSATAIKRGVVNLFSPDSAQNQTMTDLVATLKNIDPDTDPQGFANAIEQMKNILADPNKRKLVFDFAEADPRLPTTEVKKGTLDLLEDDIAEKGYRGPGVDNENVDEIIRLRQFENAVKGNKLSGEELQPNRALQNTLDQTREVFGGEATIKPAAEGITSGLEQKLIRPAQEEVGALRAAGEDTQQALVDAIKTDPFFVQVAKDLTKYNPSVGKMSDDVGMDLVQRLNQNYDEMTTVKNKLFSDPAMEAVIGSPRLIQEQIARIDRIDPTIIPKDLRAKLSGPLTLRQMEEISNFNITDLIGAARNKETYKKADLLAGLKRSMTSDQIPYLRARHKKGDAAAIRAIDAADAFYQKYLPWRTNPILSDVADNYVKPDRFLTKNIQEPVEAVRALEEGVIESGTKTGGSVYTDQMVDFMENQFKNGAQDVDVLVDFALTNIAKDAQRILNTGGKLDVQSVGPILRNLEKIGPLLQKADPIRYEQLIQFGEGLQKNALKMEDIDSFIAGASKNLEGREAQVYDNIAQEFYSRDAFNQTRSVLPDNYESFKQLFASGDNSRINQMLDVIKDNPIAMDGVKSAYTKYLRDEFLSRPGTALDKSNLLNIGSLKELSDPESAAYAQARMVLGDKYAENLRALTDHVYKINSRVKTGKELGGVDPKSGEKQSRMALDKIITLVFGPLDRTGARLRTLTGQYVDAANMSAYAKAFIDEVLANPQAFDDALTVLQTSRAGMVSAETKKMLRKSLYRGVLRRMGASDAPEPIDQQTESLFGTEGVGKQSSVPF